MVRTHVNRLTVATAAAFAAAGLLAWSAPPADAQEAGGRYRVLVPNLEPQADANRRFGENVASEVRKLIDGMDTHAAVDPRDVRNALRQLRLNENELSCIQWRQLAGRMEYEVVMCGNYREVGGENVVNSSFQGARSGEPFDVPEWTGSDARQAAAHIHQAFQNYVDQLRLASFCVQYLQSQQWDNALQTCDQALEANPNSVTALYGRAEALMKKAEELEDNGIGGPMAMDDDEEIPAVPDPIEMAGPEDHSPEYTRLMEESLDGFRKVLDVNPIHENALVSAGYVATKLGRTDEAREYFDRKLELDPGNVDVRLQIALDMARAGDPAGALRIAEDGIADTPDNAVLREYAGHFAMGAAQHAFAAEDASANELFEKALMYYGEVFEAKGAEAEPATLRAMLGALSQLGRHDEAADLGGRIVAARSDDAAIWLAYASALQRAGRVDDALTALDRVEEIDPDASGVSSRRGQWLLERGQLARAREALQRAVERGEIAGEQAANLVFGVGYNQRFQQGQHDAAMDYFALAREFAESPRVRAMTHFFTGYILLERGKRVQDPGTAASARQALPIFQRALEHLQNAGAYQEQASARQQLIGATQQYIEIQDALIRRGR